MKSEFQLEKISWNQAYLTDAIWTRQLRLSGLKVAGNAEKQVKFREIREISWNQIIFREITYLCIGQKIIVKC